MSMAKFCRSVIEIQYSDTIKPLKYICTTLNFKNRSQSIFNNLAHKIHVSKVIFQAKILTKFQYVCIWVKYTVEPLIVDLQLLTFSAKIVDGLFFLVHNDQNNTFRFLTHLKLSMFSQTQYRSTIYILYYFYSCSCNYYCFYMQI